MKEDDIAQIGISRKTEHFRGSVSSDLTQKNLTKEFAFDGHMVQQKDFFLENWKRKQSRQINFVLIGELKELKEESSKPEQVVLKFRWSVLLLHRL